MVICSTLLLLSERRASRLSSEEQSLDTLHGVLGRTEWNAFTHFIGDVSLGPVVLRKLSWLRLFFRLLSTT